MFGFNRTRPLYGTIAALVALVWLSGCVPRADDSSDKWNGFTPTDYQDVMWSSIMGGYPDAERPDIEVVRVITNDDFAVIYTDCMSEEGFTVEVFEDTSFSADIPPDQQEAFDMAMYVCEAKYPRPMLLTQPDDEHTGRVLYSYYEDELIPCLEGLGFTIDPLPSEQTFLENLHGGQRYDPYASLIVDGGLTIERWDAANAQCPQRPSELGD